MNCQTILIFDLKLKKRSPLNVFCCQFRGTLGEEFERNGPTRLEKEQKPGSWWPGLAGVSLKKLSSVQFFFYNGVLPC